MRPIMRAWSSERLVVAALDGAALPVGLRDIAPIRVDAEVSPLVARVEGVARGAHVPPAASAPPSATRQPKRDAAWIAGLAAVAIVVVVCLGWFLLNGQVQQLELPSSAPPSAEPPAAEPPTTAPSYRHEYRPDTLPRPAPSPRPAPHRGETEAAHGLSITLPILGAVIVGVLAGAGVAWTLTARARRAAPAAAFAPAAPAPGAASLPGPVQVFISYSHQDESVVDDLVGKIEAMGYPVWIDRDGMGSARYAGQIVGAIRTSRLVALMCSKSAFASDHVIREVYVAGDLKKPFVAFLLDPSDFPDDILYFVTGFPRIPVEGATLDALREEFSRAAGSRR